ncbi:hypothetical protein RJZ56_001308 [Blastomyces dermatitidis]|uniref:Uncharacterized protein n=2 Tax=Ajellomyces dermatitidis TaxID=5039 RepID=F2T5E9_AJEDA|nr:hypothetical protein BDDG_01311 [Blastomyces dermatitidis ATCC 18188]
MQPNHLEPHRPVSDGNQERIMHGARDAVTAPPPRETVIQSRNTSGGRHNRSEDSWIEVASQPSSSSLSSVTANDDIITTGLRVRQRRHHRIQRHTSASDNFNIHYSRRSPSVPGSSQDEYEESESESDRVLSSSNEDIAARSRGNVVLIRGNSSASEATISSDEDDNSTALGLNSNPPAFTPQPNAFSHPPASQTQRPRQSHFVTNPASTRSSYRPGTRRNSRSSIHSARHRQQQHSPYNMISPSYQADNDAALRASLSTLLSCAAAARGLPKHDTQPPTAERPEPAAFRLVPESVALGEDPSQERARETVPTFNNIAGQQSRTPRSASSKRAASPNSAHKARRKPSPSRNHSPSSKRSRRVSMSQYSSIITPTVMTWVISAGVVVLFSAISFSAGYVLGREVGHTETAHGLGSNGLGGFLNGSSSADDQVSGIRAGAGCGKEAVKGGLRRLRWVGGSAGSSISA